MFRYIALVWNVSDEQQSRTAESLDEQLRAQAWRPAFTGRGLRVFCADEGATLRALPLVNDAGVVLGTLFERNRSVDDDSPARRAVLSARSCEQILASQGRWLIESCWGNYVALLHDAAAGTVRVLKDPTGTLPCFKTRFENVTLLFSNIGDCIELGVRRFSIDPAYLRARVLGFSSLETNALEAVEQIRRGECVELDPAARAIVRSRRFYWDPFTFLEPRSVIEDPERAATSMRATVRSCTQTLSVGHASLLHRLSGGLDSSIVAGCLGRASTEPRIACYTFFNPHGHSDERPWARLAAEHSGFEHLEYPVDPAEVDFPALVRPRPATEPVSLISYMMRGTIDHRLATERKVTAVFTGDGGDSGFCSDSFPYAVTDYLRRHGPRLAALRLASEVALRTERSTGAVLLRSMRQWLFGGKTRELFPALLMGSRLVSTQLRDAFAMPETFPHPWFSHLRQVPWDVIRRLGTLVTTPEFYNVIDPAQPEPELISPLYAQPAMELFLRIPIHIHAEGGRDRGLARRAFVREVPQPILQRLWKDRAPGFHSELLLRNLDLVRELFLDGVLIRDGLLDRAAVEAALAPGPSKTEVLPVEIYRHLDVEIWARYWSDQRIRRP
ncbi:MAG TPA: asparagine synthase-related protein [Steroidobacteraceae bacterium]|nr:asparagine synthase-related protein [Steroidobacteraceae bacterium]